jgi:hypothetical protein
LFLLDYWSARAQGLLMVVLLAMGSAAYRVCR